MAAITICSDFGAPQNKVWHCFHCFPIYLPWSDGTRCHDLGFWMLSFMPTFSLSPFIFIKRLFSSSLLSAIRVVSSVYLRLLIFLLAILIPVVLHPVQHFHDVLSSLSPHSLASAQTAGREHSLTHQQKIGLRIYWAWPQPSELNPVSPSVSLSHQEASTSLLSLSFRG